MWSFVREWWLFTLGILLVVVGAASWLSSSRQVRLTTAEAEAIATVLAVTPISRVADVGAGEGQFTVEMARRHVPEGYVFSTEVDVERLRAIGRRTSEAGLDNVTIIEGRGDATGLPPACCDGIFVRRVYHHLTDPGAVVADLYRAARSGGRVAIIDFVSEGLLPWVAPVRGVPADRGGHGVPPEVVTAEMTAAGFVLIEERKEWLGGGFCLVFQKP